MRKILSFPVLLFLLSLFFRTIYLDRIPIGITSDELDYMINAKSVYLTGKDIGGTWSPFSFTTPPFEIPKGELPYLYLAPIIGPFPFSLFMARLPSAIMGSLMPVLMYLLALRFFGKKVAIFSGLVLCFNPWGVWFSRTGYDTPMSVFWYLFALVLLFRPTKVHIFISTISLVFAFFSYVGMKLLLFPLVLLILLYRVHTHVIWKNKGGSLLLMLICFICIGYFSYNLLTRKAANRSSDLLLPNATQIVKTVNFERQLSMINPLGAALTNKYSVYLRESLDKYFAAFDIRILFIHGEQTAFYSLWNQGFFYVVDILFLFPGIYFIMRKSMSGAFLVLGSICIAPIPSVLNAGGDSFAIRSSFMYPLLGLVVGAGLVAVYEYVQRYQFYKVVLSILILIYSVSFVSFGQNYFFRNPIYNSETFNFSGRLVSKYLQLAAESGSGVVVVDKSKTIIENPLLKQYIFYTYGLDAANIHDLSKVIQNTGVSYGGFNQSGCEEVSMGSDDAFIIPAGQCPDIVARKKRLTLSRLSDGGSIYDIYNDSVCSGTTHSRYVSQLHYADLQIEKMDAHVFCQKFVTNLE